MGPRAVGVGGVPREGKEELRCGGQTDAPQSCPRSRCSVRAPGGCGRGGGVPDMQARGTQGYHSYLCAAPQVLPCASAGQLPNASLRGEERESNLEPAREKGAIILPVITTQLCCNHSNKTKADKR